MTNHPEGSWSMRCIPGTRLLRIPHAEFGNTTQVSKNPQHNSGSHAGEHRVLITRMQERLISCETSARTGGEVGKPGLARSPAWKVLDTLRDNRLSFACYWTTPIIPNAANCAVLCPCNWVQLPIHRDARSLLTAEINTAYTNTYPYGFAIHLPKLEYFLVTQLNATIIRFNTLLPFWPEVQYKMQGIQPYCVRN